MILVTGATGFVGSALVNDLSQKSYRIRTVSRSKIENQLTVEQSYLPCIDDSTDWTEILDGVDVVIHTAARVHLMNDNSDDPLSEFRKINVLATVNLARQAACNNVKRFIFISSIKVNGEQTFDVPFTEAQLANPIDPYGISKYEAEKELIEISETTAMEVVIIRPPLVYGPNVKANFLNLLKLADTKFPLPLKNINNSRSIVFINNLSDFIIKCIDHPNARNQIFLVSDQNDLSTSELIELIRKSLHNNTPAFTFPMSLFRFLCWILRKQSMLDRLTGNLQIDCSKATRLLGWTPPFTTKQSIDITVQFFMSKKND